MLAEALTVYQLTVDMVFAFLTALVIGVFVREELIILWEKFHHD